MKNLLVLLSLISSCALAIENKQFSLEAETDAIVAEINSLQLEEQVLFKGIIKEARNSEFPALLLTTMGSLFSEGAAQTLAFKIADVVSQNCAWSRFAKVNLTEAACELDAAIKIAGYNAVNDVEIQAKRQCFNDSMNATSLSDEDCKELLKSSVIEFCDLLLEKLN